MDKRSNISKYICYTGIGIAGLIALWLIVTFVMWIVKELNTDYTYKTVKGTAVITKMDFEEGEWESKPKTKEVKKKDGTTTTETVYVKEWDEPEYEINFEFKDKLGKTETYYYEEEESSELYDYLKSHKLMRGDKVDIQIQEVYGNGEYRHSNMKDVKAPKDSKYRRMLE